MEITMQSIGERIKARRLELHLTQTHIFEKCGIASGPLSRIENGKNVPSVIAFYKLSQVLECDMNWLVTGFSTNMQNSVFCENEEKLLNGFRKLSEEDKEEIIEYMDFKINRFSKKKSFIETSSSLDTETNLA